MPGVLPFFVISANVLIFFGGAFFVTRPLLAIALVALGAGWSGIIYASLYWSAYTAHHQTAHDLYAAYLRKSREEDENG